MEIQDYIDKIKELAQSEPIKVGNIVTPVVKGIPGLTYGMQYRVNGIMTISDTVLLVIEGDVKCVTCANAYKPRDRYPFTAHWGNIGCGGTKISESMPYHWSPIDPDLLTCDKIKQMVVVPSMLVEKYIQVNVG